MQNGTVKWYEDAKKFGFILGDNGTEYFLHKDELEAPDNPPREGDRVQFSVQAHHRGPKAKSVRRLPPSMTATVAPTASPPQTPGGALTHRPLGALEGMAPSRALSNRLGIYLGLVPTKTTESGFELGHALRQSQDFRAGTVELFDYAQGKSTRTPALVLELVRLLAARGITKDPELAKVLTGIEWLLGPLFLLLVPHARSEMHRAVMAHLQLSVRRNLLPPQQTQPVSHDAPEQVPAPAALVEQRKPQEPRAPETVPKTVEDVHISSPPPQPAPPGLQQAAPQGDSSVVLIEQVAALRSDTARKRVERIHSLARQLEEVMRQFEREPFEYAPSNMLGRTLEDIAAAASSASEQLSGFLATNEELASQHGPDLHSVERAIGRVAVSSLSTDFVDQLARPDAAQRAARIAHAMEAVGDAGPAWLGARWFEGRPRDLERFNHLLANSNLQEEASGFVEWSATLSDTSRKLLCRSKEAQGDVTLLEHLKTELDRLLEIERDQGQRRARIGLISEWIGEPFKQRLETERSADCDALLSRAEGLIARLKGILDQLHPQVVQRLKGLLVEWPADPAFPKGLEAAEEGVLSLGELARTQTELETLTRLARMLRKTDSNSVERAPTRGQDSARQTASFAHPLSREKATYAADLAWIQQPGVPYGVVKLPVRFKCDPPMERAGEWTVESSCDLLNNVPEDWRRQFPSTRTLVMQAGSTSKDFEIELPLSAQTADLAAMQKRNISVTLSARRGTSHGDVTLSWQGLRRSMPAYQPPFSQTVSKQEMVRLPLGVENQFDGLRELVEAGRKSFRVHGPRRMGKTTLVRALVEHFTSSSEVIVLSSVVAAEFRSPQELWDEVALRLSSRFNRPVTVGTGLVPVPGAFDAVREEAHRGKARAIYVLIDEAQALFSGSGDPHRLGEALKSRLELEWGTRTETKAAILLGLIGQAHLPDLMGGNLLGAISDSFTTDAISEKELLPLLRGHTDLGLQSTKEAREALTRLSGNLFILERLLARVAEICRTEGRPWFFEEDVESSVRRLVEADRDRTETTSWSYVRDVLNESDDKNTWRPADTFPVAMAWAFVRGFDPKSIGASREEKLHNILIILEGWCEGVSLRRDRVEEAFSLLHRQRVLRRDDSFELPVLERLLQVRAEGAPFADEVDRRALTRLGLVRLAAPRAEGAESTGGQASVYRSTHSGKPVAVRRVRLGTAKAEQRFIRETMLLERLRDSSGALTFAAQPHLPRLFACGVDSASADIGLVIYEWIEGTPLDEIDLTAAGALLVLRGLARALEALNGSGILHRDIRPANVIIRQRTLDPVLIDFGLSVAVDEVAKSTTLSGVVEFLPPEVVEGGQAKWSHAGDLYSVGYSVLARLTPSARQDQRLTTLLQQLTSREPERRPGAAALLAEVDEMIATQQVNQRVDAVRQEFVQALSKLPPAIRDPVTGSAGDFVASRSGVAAPRTRLAQVSEFLENLVQAKVQLDHGQTAQAIRTAGMSTYLRALSALGDVPPSLQPLVTPEARAVGSLRNASAHPTELERIFQDALRELPLLSGERLPRPPLAQIRRLEGAVMKVGESVANLLSRPEIRKLVVQWLAD